MINKYWDSLIYGTLLTVFTYAVSYYFDWAKVAELNYVELFAIWTSYICTLMCTFQTRWNYPIGIVTTAAYSYLYLYVWDLPNLGYFNLYLVFSLTYGFFRWKSDADTRPVEHITGYWWLGYVGLGVAVYGLLYTINAVLQKEMTFMDTATAVLSGVAQFGLDNKKLQNWILWIVVDVISLYLYYTQNLPFVFIQYVFFTANAVWAYYVWKQGMTSVTTTATRPVVSLTLDGETVQY